MESTIFLGQDVLSEPREIRRILLAHTRDEMLLVDLLRSLERSHPEEPPSWCVLHASGGFMGNDGRDWTYRFGWETG